MLHTWPIEVVSYHTGQRERKRGSELIRRSELNLPARNAGRIPLPSPGFSGLVAGVSKYLAHVFFHDRGRVCAMRESERE